ncbi:MAG TPA: hypothetical protein DCL06_06250 [Corynebacterium variabile]|uniref:Uncharacterized protein n=1 Tax=Corynebacterium variabile TaxID=1727 RepID=A0A3B9QU53_9CORY|nr:hypothetical protein [Corynebacterium variabile]
MTFTPPAKPCAKPVRLGAGDVHDGVLWLTWRGEYILTSSVNNRYAAETMAFPSDVAGFVTDWADLGTVGPCDHPGCIRAAGYTPLP